jgi:glutathione peroxidase
MNHTPIRSCAASRLARAALALALAAPLALLSACGDPGAKDPGSKSAAPASGQGTHKHDGSDPDCPMCKSLKEQAEAEKKAASPATTPPSTEPGVLDITMKSIDGKDVDLAQYKGKVVMIVNVASRCGFTPQYKGLQALYDAKEDQGFVVLGFPANDFMGQEPGTSQEIAQFCSTTYGVTFPMFEKISVVGDTQHELYKRLTLAAKDMGGQPGWNFTKYLIGRDGKLAARFKHSTSPQDRSVVEAVDRLLATK